jgi:uncharacterized membrane protein
MAYPLILRIIHIGDGVIWAGVAIFVSFILSPAAARKGPDGPKAMGMLLTEAKYSLVLSIAGGLTVLSGILLWLHDTAYFKSIGWAQSPTGTVFTIGAILGFIALIVGGAIAGPAFNKMSAVGAEIAQAGGPPAPEKLALLGKLQDRLTNSSMIGGILLVLTVLAMATARYIR